MSDHLVYPWLETPLILSSHLSELLDCNIYLKLENLQPSQSFKYRGISLYAQHCKATHGDNVHLIIPSGGNAGLAAACAANHLGIRCTVYLPKGASQDIVERLEREKAEVVVVGDLYLEAAREARKAVENDKHACYVHGYEGAVLWKGHGSMVTEISWQLPIKPDAIFCSVGGGGLLGGIIDGCKSANWDDVPLVAVETHGAAAFYHSVSLSKQWIEHTPLPPGTNVSEDEGYNIPIANIQITSRASSLAATSPSAHVVNAALHRKAEVTCVTIPDEMAMHTTCMFADDHKILAELACSTTLAIAYHPALFRRILEKHTKKRMGGSEERTNVVFIVCGGVKISSDEVQEYAKAVEDELARKRQCWEVFCDGERWDIPLQQVGS